jgi:predicted RNase H-like HicB family nuclease
MGWLWMLRTFGLRLTWSYYQARRDHLIVDFDRIFTPKELAAIEQLCEEAGLRVPWELSVEVEPDELDGGFIAECLDVPGAMAQGETQEEALESLIDAVQAVVAARMAAEAIENVNRRLVKDTTIVKQRTPKWECIAQAWDQTPPLHSAEKYHAERLMRILAKHKAELDG